MTNVISRLQTKQQAMTNQFTLLSAGAGGAFYQTCIRRQCLIALRDIQACSDDDLDILGISRPELAKAELRLRAGQTPDNLSAITPDRRICA